MPITETTARSLATRFRTSEASARERAAGLRLGLSAQAEQADPSQLWSTLVLVTEAEEETSTYAWAAIMIENGKADRLPLAIAGRLSLGADDTWSGRMNDLRRVVFDARRTTLSRILTALEFADAN